MNIIQVLNLYIKIRVIYKIFNKILHEKIMCHGMVNCNSKIYKQVKIRCKHDKI